MDLSGSLRGRDLDDAARHLVRGAIPEAGGGDRVAHSGRCRVARFRRAVAGVLAVRSRDDHFTQLLRGVAHTVECHGLGQAQPADARQAYSDLARFRPWLPLRPASRWCRRRTSWPNSANFSPYFCTCSLRGPRSIWWISTDVRKGHYSVREIFNCDGMYGRWNWRGLWAYGIGFAAMIPFFSTESWKGPVARALGGADIAMLVGLPVSALVYIAACRSLDVARGPPSRARRRRGTRSQCRLGLRVEKRVDYVGDTARIFPKGIVTEALEHLHLGVR